MPRDGLRSGDTAAVVAAAREALASYRAGRMLARHHDALERAINALVVERGRCAWNAIPVPGAPNQERCAAACAKACAHDDPCFCADHDPYPGVRPSDTKASLVDAIQTELDGAARRAIRSAATISPDAAFRMATRALDAGATPEMVRRLLDEPLALQTSRSVDSDAAIAREHSVSQLLRDALVALDSDTPHREKHARQAIERALRIAEGK